MKLIYRLNEDIKPGDIFRKYFVTEHNLDVNNEIELKFQKQKTIFDQDSNSESFNLQRLKIKNVENDKV